MKISERYKGCVFCGAIGDAYGSTFENVTLEDDSETFYVFGKPKEEVKEWAITDDTQLTLATSEVITEHDVYSPEDFANTYLQYFNRRKITGIGSSTLKTLTELQAGGHWSQVGRRGEYAAGNGAAMRIAPLAFVPNFDREQLRAICNITHNNDEAYVGALAVFLAIRSATNGEWTSKENLIEIVAHQLPDTRVRDRLLEIKNETSISNIGLKGNNGYVVNSVPLAIAAANQIHTLGLEKMFDALIEVGGDTDTNCSIAGQIVGSLIGVEGIPTILFNKLIWLKDYEWIESLVTKFAEKLN